MTKILNHINTYADLTAYNNDMSKDFPNISYIQGTDEVKWNKYDPDHIVAVYNVTSTSNATKLLNKDSGITYQIIDGVKQDAVQTSYTFDTLGEHTVKYKLSGTSINSNQALFYMCPNLVSVVIPETITSIDGPLFGSSSNLTNVVLPKTLTFIGERVFGYCSKLKTISIPDSVTSIGQEAFDACIGLTSIDIPSGVTSIGNYVFSSCTSLTRLNSDVDGLFNIPDNVTSIGNNAFSGCYGLTSVTIPDSVTSIGDNAFANLINFRGNLVLPSTLATLGNTVFNNMRNATGITFLSTTPPTAGTNLFINSTCPIYVPAESVEAFKTATNWSTYASRIQAIS